MDQSQNCSRLTLAYKCVLFAGIMSVLTNFLFHQVFELFFGRMLNLAMYAKLF